MQNSPIDRAGTWRGKVIEHGVSESRNGFPQLQLAAVALEYYDETGEHTGGEPGWVDWSAYGAVATGHMVLFNADGPLLNNEQAQKAFGWDGSSFAGLAQMDLSEKMFLFRTEENEYNGKTSIRIGWIDDYEANPTRSIKCADPAKLKELDSKFGLKAKAVPAKAPAKPTPTASVPKSAPAPSPAKPQTAAPKVTSAPAPKAAPKPAPAPAPAPQPAAEGGISKEEAWNYLYENRGNSSDDEIATAWLAACEQVGDSEDAFTPADWLNIRDTAAGVLGIAGKS